MGRRDYEKFIFYAGDDEDSEDSVVDAGGGEDDDDDDLEANEDLSLKILQKALLRRAVESSRNEVDFDDSNERSLADLSASSSGGMHFTVVNGEKSEGFEEEKVKLKNNKMKIEIDNAPETHDFGRSASSFCTLSTIVPKDEEGVDMVVVGSTEEKAVVDNTNEVEKSMKQNTLEIFSNMVLRKLLDGPRYFDPLDGGWDSCYNCGERGHMARNCPSLTKRKKPCFLCGSLEHDARQCAKAQDCFIHKKRSHQVKVCPDKYTSGSKGTTICLRCGDPGHDMFSCNCEYSQDDLKEIQCYVCKSFGHLCCVNPMDSPRWVLSCCRCGQLGHNEQACDRLKEEGIILESPGSSFRRGERGHFVPKCANSSGINFSQGEEWPSLCYKCGEEGHIARWCRSSIRRRKRKLQHRSFDLTEEIDFLLNASESLQGR